jgi:hypothetical protein
MTTVAETGKKRASAAQAHPAASAAAASFAALVGKLDYLSPAEIESVRQAYRADRPLGRCANSIHHHPIAVAPNRRMETRCRPDGGAHATPSRLGVTEVVSALAHRWPTSWTGSQAGTAGFDREQNQPSRCRCCGQPGCAGHPDQAGRPHPQRAHGDCRAASGSASTATLEIYAPSRTAWG